MSLYRLRYVDGAYDGRFASIRYPRRRGVDMATAEHMRAAMPDPKMFVIVEEED